MAHFERHPRSRSYDHNLPRRQYEEDDENRRVHFDDGSIVYSRRGSTRQNTPRDSQCSIQETTTKLKSSYENIEKGLNVLHDLQNSLQKCKQPVTCGKCQSNHDNKEELFEIERLLNEIEQLQEQLGKAGDQKRKYLEELSRLQNTLHRDRKKMEGFVRNSNTSNKKIKNKIQETSKRTRDQQVLITKLKTDNATLWKTLQEIQDHLHKENTSDIESLASIDINDDYIDKKLPQKINLHFENITQPLSSDRSQNISSGDGSQNSIRQHDNFSYDSAHDNYLSDKLKSLIYQSKNIQNMISKVGDTAKCNNPQLRQQSNVHHFEYGRRYSDVRIPSENEKGVRSDMNDIIKRCEELEQRVDECSTGDIRQRLLQQLSDIDSNSSGIDGKDNYQHEQKIDNCIHHQNPQLPWQPDQHKKVREELLKCLDKIIHLEKSFKGAQDEIQRLRKYIQDSAEEKEFSEKSYKREALELRLIMDDRNKEIVLLKSNVNDALLELKDKEHLLNRIEKLETLLDEKDIEMAELKCGNENDILLMKRTLNSKNMELDQLKAEMRSAIESMDNLRRYGSNSTTNLQTQVNDLQLENKKLRESLQENIREELSYLQIAILETERQMKELAAENKNLKLSLETKEQHVKESEQDNQDLIQRLKISEDEIQFLQTRLELIDNEFGFTSITIKDNQIHQLTLDRDKSLAEKLKAMQDLTENRNEFEEKLQLAINDKDILESECEAEIQRLQNELQRSRDEKQIAYNALTNQDQEMKKLENKVRKLSAEYVDATQYVRYSTNNYQTSAENNENNLTNNKESIVEVLKYKDQIIDSLRDNIDVLSREIEKYAMKDDRNGNGNEIANELINIRKSMHESHHELVDKIVELQREIRLLQTENKTLKEQSSNTPSLNLNNVQSTHDVKKLKVENTVLKQALEKSYPGLVDNILTNSEKLKTLQDENYLLRIALSKDRLELVDSNLRKRERIKRLEKELEELNNEPPPYKLMRRRRSSSLGDVHLLTKENVLSDAISREDRYTRDKLHDKTRDETRDNKSRDEILEEMRNQNNVILKLQQQNEKHVNENKLLKKEKDDLKSLSRSNQALENELISLRNAFKHFGNDDGKIESQNKIKQLEAEMKELKTINAELYKVQEQEGLSLNSRAGSSRDTYVVDLRDEISSLTTENNTLKSDLDVASNNLFRLARIIDREQKLSPNLFDKNNMKRVETKASKMDDENGKLKFSLNNAQVEIDQLNEEMVKLKDSTNYIKTNNEELMIENNRLKANLSDEHKKNENFTELNKHIDILNQTVATLEIQNNELRNELHLSRTEKEHLVNVNTNFNQKKFSEMTKTNDTLNEKLKQIRNENEDLDRRNKSLTNDLENVRKEVTETNFMEWLENDVDKRVAMLSPDIQYNDGTFDSNEQKTKRDASRIIRKLQIENQILRGKLLNMEDEAVETIKLMADMERGHGHLTGTLRSHLILQKNTTMKILEGSLQQYTSDFEILKKKFKTLEEKYDSEKKYSKQRDYAWDMFTNALATINNINTILHEGLIKVEEDLQNDFSDDDFESKDYKSRLWILRRRLSDVENRHRELQLRSEELNLRLDAKQTEFEVTQDELEGTTRDLESRETSLYRLKVELDKIANENDDLHKLIESLKENQHKTIGDVFKENEKLRTAAKEYNKQNPKGSVKAMETSFDDMVDQLEEKDAALKIMRRMRDDTSKEAIELKKRISVLERRLKEMTEQRDKLKKEAENRAGYMGASRDDHGTIHMLRDDIKQLAKENTELKQDIVLKHRQMYGMSKDLHKLRMEKELKKGEQSKSTKDENTNKMINDLAELKAEKFLLETRLQDVERRKNKTNTIEDIEDENFIENSFKNKLIAKEKELEKMKRELTFVKEDNKLKLQNKSKDDTMSDLGGSVFDTDNGDANKDSRIKEKEIERIIEEKEDEVNHWRMKAENLETELKRLQSHSRVSMNDDDKFQKLYLHKITPDGGMITPDGGMQHVSAADSYLDMSTQHDSVDGAQRPTELILTGMDGVQRPTDLMLTGTVVKEDDNNRDQQFPDEPPNDGAPRSRKKQKSNIPSRIPISPQKKKKLLPSPKTETPVSPSKGHTSEINQMQQAKKLAGQVEDIQLLLRSTDAYSAEQVNTILILLDELSIYRTILGLNEHETLPILGEDKLCNIVEYHLHSKQSTTEDNYKEDCMILTLENETIKQEFDTLQNSYNTLKQEFTDLQLLTECTNQSLSSRGSVESYEKDSEILALTEKYAIRTDENTTLQELLETQTQNVKSQESVIKTLKKDIKSTKSRFNKEYDNVFQELKAKKIELRNLKKENKELKKSIHQQKEELNSRKKEEFSEKDYFINELQMEIDELNEIIDKQKNEGNDIEQKVEEACQLGKQELKIKEQEYEEVLKYAESALEDAKKKLNDTNTENNELKIKLDEIENEKRRDKEVFNDIKIELKTALDKKNDLIKSVQKEYSEYKNSKEKEFKMMNKQITELERQCKDYKLLLNHSETSTSELNSQISSLQNTLSNTKSTLDDIKSERDRLHIEHETLSSSPTDKTSRADASLKTDATFITDSVIPLDVTENRFNELEIEFEIVKGCNEELEETCNGLTKKIENYEKTLEKKNKEHENILYEHDQIKKDLEKSLEFLREIDSKNDELGEYNNMLITKNKHLEKQNTDLLNNSKIITEQFEKDNQISEIQEQLLKSVLINEKDQKTIKEMEIIIDQYEHEIKMRDNEIDLMKQIERDINNKLELTVKKYENDMTQKEKKSKESDFDIASFKKSPNTELETLRKENINMENIFKNEIIDKNSQIHSLEDQINDLQTKLEFTVKKYENDITENENKSKKSDFENASFKKEFDTELETLRSEKYSIVNKLALKENELYLVHQDNEKYKTKIKSLKETISEKSNQNEDLEIKLHSCSAKLSENKEIIKNLSEKEKDFNTVEESEKNNDLENEISLLKFDVANKNALLKTLQSDMESQHEQYTSVLNALNKRREESKLFLAMQDKLQSEIERKEDIIKNLKFKLRSNNLDLSLDQTDGGFDVTNVSSLHSWIEEGNISDKETLIADQRQGLELLTEQLSLSRQRNRSTMSELEKLRTKFLNLELSSRTTENENQSINKSNEELKEKLKELRNFIQESPNTSFTDENKAVHLQTKLYTAYKELREKSIEIATLKMNTELKIIELDNSKQQLSNLNLKKHSKEHKFTTNIKCNHSLEIHSLVKEIHEHKEIEHRLQEENSHLKDALFTKRKEYDFLNLEFSNVTERLKMVETNLMEEDKYLKARYVYGSEENSEISEITSISHPSSNRAQTAEDSKKNISANDTFLIDGFADNSTSESSVTKTQIKIENEYLKKEIQIKKQIEEELRIEIKELKILLRNSNDELIIKNNKILFLEEKMTDLQTDNNDELSKYRKKILQYEEENKKLKDQMNWNSKRFEIELETLRVTLTNLKDEHVNSLKKDIEGTSKEKIILQVKVKEIEEILKAKEKKINLLLKTNGELLEDVKRKNEALNEALTP